MTEYIELEFHIEPATPETMPIDELFNIVKALTSELGAKNNMHFKEVRSGCACAVINIEKNEFPKVAEKVQEPKLQKKVNKKLAYYNKYGYVKTANDNEKLPRVDFEGIKLYEKEENITIYDETQIKGKIISIYGKDSTVNINLLGTSGEEYNCKISAKEAQNMFWGQYIQADVSGEWILLDNDKWDTPPRKKLNIDKYKTIKMYDAKTIIEKMASIISEETYNKIQENIKADMQEAE